MKTCAKLLSLYLLNFSLIHADLIKPENLDTLSYTHMLFEWEQEPYALNYNLQISNSDSFNEIIVDTISYKLIYIDKENINWENTYYCRLRYASENEEWGNWIDTLSFTIGSSKHNTNTTVETNENYNSKDITIYGDLNRKATIAFDVNGNEIWNDANLETKLVYVNEFGELYSQAYQGESKALKYNFKNNLLWLSEHGVDQHDVKELPNGNFLYFKTYETLGPIPLGDWTPQFQALGYIADGETLEFPWIIKTIVEVDKNTNEVIWEWDPINYLSMEHYDQYGGTWLNALQTGKHDWLHKNSIWFDEGESKIYFSVRQLSKVIKIDYPTGNIVWEIGPPTEYGTGDSHICTNLLFSWQHDFELLQNGNFLLFDNGNLSEIFRNTEYKTSRILEFDIIDNNTCNVIWEYDLPEVYYGTNMGSVELLNNGNYLVNTRALNYPSNKGHIFEATSEKEIIWDLGLNLGHPISGANYRAFRIPGIHPEAFSSVFNSLENININDNEELGFLVSEDNQMLDITTFNESNYNQSYQYTINDTYSWFNSIDTTMFINANDFNYFLINLENINSVSTDLTINAIPTNHNYNSKTFYFTVFRVVDNKIVGDLNEDQFINISDILLLTNNVLSYSFNTLGDINLDDINNISDIIKIIDFVLND